MTPEERNEWLKVLLDPTFFGSNPMVKIPNGVFLLDVGWSEENKLVGHESIEHPTITSYFDHLYAQELGIAYP